jgi:two-component system, NarL family, response regulator LiaR
MNNSDTSSGPIHVLIVDDHGMVRFGLRGFIESVPRLQVVGEAGSGEEALIMMETLEVDIVLMDLVLPGMTGAEATREISKRFPLARVIILTSFIDDAHILSAVKAGAASYLLKDISPDDLSTAVLATYNGQSILHPKVMAQVASHITPAEQIASDLVNSLSERELEVLRLLTRGLQNNEIAQKLSVSENTIRTHISNILMKLDLRDRTQAALFGVRFFNHD